MDEDARTPSPEAPVEERLLFLQEKLFRHPYIKTGYKKLVNLC